MTEKNVDCDVKHQHKQKQPVQHTILKLSGAISYLPIHSGYQLTGTSADSADPVKMPPYIPFHLGLYCVLG